MLSNNTYINIITELSIQSRGQNKYLKWYLSIIKKAQNRNLINYFERHHIVPSCFFINNKRNTKNGFLTDNSENVNNYIKLTAEEHKIVHLLLIKMFSPKFLLYKSLVYSAIKMSSDAYGNRINNKTYAWLRKLHSISMTGKNNPCYNRIWINNGILQNYILSSESIPNGWVKGQLPKKLLKENNSNYKKKWITNGIIEQYVEENYEIPNNWYKGRLKSKIPPSRIGIKNSSETRKKLSLAKSGTKMPKEFSIICSNSRSEYWVIIDPRGIFFKTKHLKEFCKNNNLTYSSATQSYRKNEISINGKNSGWRFIKLNN